MKTKLALAGAAVSALLLLGATPADAAGGKGTSYCSNAGRPDGVVTDDFDSYDNPGELVSALAPLRGDPGWGWGIQAVCNPKRFAG
jgi:hypothetical protein